MSDKPITFADLVIPYDQFQISGLIGWIECNGFKPLLHVDTNYPGVVLPPHSMSKPYEAISVASSAIVKTTWGDTEVSFNTRFNKQDFRVRLPYHSIVAMVFGGTSLSLPMPWFLARQKAALTDNGPQQHESDGGLKDVDGTVQSSVPQESSAEPVVRAEHVGGSASPLFDDTNVVVRGNFGKPREKK